MSYAVRVVCRPELAAGFALAGLQAVPAGSAPAAGAAVEDLARTPGVGVILVEEEFHALLPAELERALSRRPLPMVVPFAGPAWATGAEAGSDYIVELLRRAIGYRVRLR